LSEAVRKLVREEVEKLFERVFATSLYGGGATTGDLADFQFGYQGFDTMPETTRIEMANNKLNQLISQYDGNEERALEELPDYMLLYI